VQPINKNSSKFKFCKSFHSMCVCVYVHARAYTHARTHEREVWAKVGLQLFVWKKDMPVMIILIVSLITIIIIITMIRKSDIG
jgi:hypothetical protein